MSNVTHEQGFFTLKVQNTQNSINNSQMVYRSVPEISSIYGISRSTLYELIKTDTQFPVVNMGVKKRLFIEQNAFENWFKIRSQRKIFQRHNIPTFTQLKEIK